MPLYIWNARLGCFDYLPHRHVRPVFPDVLLGVAQFSEARGSLVGALAVRGDGDHEGGRLHRSGTHSVLLLCHSTTWLLVRCCCAHRAVHGLGPGVIPGSPRSIRFVIHRGRRNRGAHHSSTNAAGIQPKTLVATRTNSASWSGSAAPNQSNKDNLMTKQPPTIQSSHGQPNSHPVTDHTQETQDCAHQDENFQSLHDRVHLSTPSEY